MAQKRFLEKWGNALLAAYLLFAFGCEPVWANVALQPLLGFGDFTHGLAFYSPNTWNPLAVRLVGNVPRGEAELKVLVSREGHQDIYVKKLLFDGGPVDEVVSFAVNLSPLSKIKNFNLFKPTLTVQLVHGEHMLSGPLKVAFPGSLWSYSYTLLLLDSRMAGLHFLSQHLFDITHKGMNLSGVGGPAAPFGTFSIRNLTYPITVLTDTPAALPTSPQGYCPIDAIALGNFDLDLHASEQQVNAIRAFVLSGGALLVAGGPDLSRLQSCPLRDMFPIQPHGTRTVARLTTLTGRYQAPVPINHPLALTTGPLQPGARVLLADPQAGPLILERPYGNGVVLFTTFDYMDPVFTSWQGAPSFWRDLLHCDNFAASPIHMLQNDGTWMGTTGDLDYLMDALANPKVTQLPPWPLLATFAFGYIFLLVPINYLVLKWLDRREWAWFTTPLIILVFSLGSYAFGASIRAHVASFNRVAVLETQAGTDEAAGFAQMAIYLPSSKEVGLTYTKSALNSISTLYYPSLMSVSDPSMVPASATIKEAEDGVVMRGVHVPFWSTCNFEAPFEVALGGPIQASVHRVSASTFHVTIANHTRFALHQAGVYFCQYTYPVGDLAPGQTVQVTLSLSPSLLNSNAYTNTLKLPGLPSTSNPQKQALFNALSNILTGNNLGGAPSLFGFGIPGMGVAQDGYGMASFLLTGWLGGPVIPVQANPPTIPGNEVALLCVHLPMPSHAENWPGGSPFEQPPLLQIPSQKQAFTNFFQGPKR